MKGESGTFTSQHSKIVIFFVQVVSLLFIITRESRINRDDERCLKEVISPGKPSTERQTPSVSKCVHSIRKFMPFHRGALCCAAGIVPHKVTLAFRSLSATSVNAVCAEKRLAWCAIRSKPRKERRKRRKNACSSELCSMQAQIGSLESSQSGVGEKET